jgi:hypothetical protein
MKKYVKYSWVGNKILADDMASLYKMKQSTRRPITALVAEAVSEYIKKRALQ